MKPQYKAGGGIVLVALLWGGASAGLFVFVGSQLAVYSLFAMLPVLAVVGFLYVRGSSGSGSEQRISEQRAREVGSRFADVYGDYRTMQETYPDLTDDIDIPFEQVIGDLEAENVSVDRETGTTSLGRFGSPDVTTLTSIEGDIDELESRMEEAFVAATREEIQHINTQLRRMEGIIEVGVGRTPDEIPQPDDPELANEDSWWRTLGRDVENQREGAREEIGRAAETLRTSMRQADDVDEGKVEQHLSNAESAETIDDGVEQVLAARDTFRQEASGSFSDRRRELLALAQAVQSAEVDTHISDARMDEFESAVENVESTDDAMEVSELRERGSQLRAVCTEIIRDLEATLGDDLDTLRNTDMPDEYYHRPNAAEENYASELASLGKLATYRSAWIDAAGELTDALETTGRKARVASMYAEIEEYIESALRRSGEVTGDDLPVKRDYEQFLGLYARIHDVEFDPSVPKLTTPGSGEQYTVTAKVSFEDSGENRRASVDLVGSEYERSKTITTYLAEVVEFEEVPYGEYTIAAVPAGTGNQPAETTVSVEGDVSVDLEMTDVSLRERLCSGYDDAVIENYLSELEGRFTETFESEGYLSTGTDFPISDEYIPCLLATWAGETGHDVARPDDRVLVYDADQIIQELQMVSQHNLDPDDSMAFDTLRERFLSAPIPAEVIRDAAAGIESLTAEDDHLHKQEN